MDIILKYFPGLTEHQIDLFRRLYPIYKEWNEKINVISRKDFDFFYERHVLHSLSIAKFIQFKPNTYILDVGTGGGFPGIPLSIIFPETNFLLVDSIGKKIKVVDAVVEHLALKNVRTQWTRAEELQEKFDFIITRAVAPLPDLWKWTGKLLEKKSIHGLHNGLIALKGGDIKEELQPFKGRYIEHKISAYFKEPYFEGKQIVYLS